MVNNTTYISDIPGKDTYYTPDSAKKAIYLSTSVTYYIRLWRAIMESYRWVQNDIYHRYNWVAASLHIMQALESVGIKISIKGMEHFRNRTKPVVFVGNHMSSAETMILPCIIQPAISCVYVMKQELGKVPYVGPVVSARHPVVVGRSNPREDFKIVLEEGTSRIQDGRSIIIFPQKTRRTEFIKREFNSMGVKLAKKAEVDIIPVALLTDAWGIGSVIKDFGKVDPSKPMMVEFGEPIPVEVNASESQKMILEFIGNKLTEWGRPELVK